MESMMGGMGMMAGGQALTDMLSQVAEGVGQIYGAQQAEQAASKAWKRTRWLYMNRYQLTMEDMRRAGLNPILAYQTMAGGSPSAPALAGGQGGVSGSATRGMVGRAMDAAMKVQESKILENTREKTFHEANKAAYDSRVSEEQALQMREYTKLAPDLYKAELANAIQNRETSAANARDMNANAVLRELQEPEASKEAQIWRSGAGLPLKVWERHIRPNIPIIRP